jgi:hypothetical protein
MKMNRTMILVAAGALLAGMGAAWADSSSHFTTSDGTRVTVTSGQPAPDNYGPPPSFAQLDANRDGSISRQEAEAYIPLFNDYDHIAYRKPHVTQAMYDKWVRTQGH